MVHIFIINPVAGLGDKTDHIRRILDRRKDIQSIVFDTEDAGDEGRIMKEMLEIFDDEDIRVYICGGSGTLSNAINEVKEDDFNHLELGFYPCGFTNDFLKNFGFDRIKFDDLNSVIDGIPRKVDYFVCKSKDHPEITYNELIFTAVGIPAAIEDISTRLRKIARLSTSVLYKIGALICVPFTPGVDYEITIDGVDYSGCYKSVYVGNSVCLGGGYFPITKNISCRDGLLNVLFINKFPLHEFYQCFSDFMHGTILEKKPNYSSHITGKNISIKRKDGKQMVVNSDGEIIKTSGWDISICHEGLKFLVPKGASIVNNCEDFVKG